MLREFFKRQVATQMQLPRSYFLSDSLPRLGRYRRTEPHEILPGPSLRLPLPKFIAEESKFLYWVPRYRLPIDACCSFIAFYLLKRVPHLSLGNFKRFRLAHPLLPSLVGFRLRPHDTAPSLHLFI